MDSRPGSSDEERQLSKLEVGPSKGPGAPPPWLYVVVRKNMSGGALLAQVAHAASEAGSWFGANANGLPLPNTTRACILGATKEQLAELAAALSLSRVPDVVAIEENEGPLAGVITAIGFVTERRDEVRPLLAHLKPMP